MAMTMLPQPLLVTKGLPPASAHLVVVPPTGSNTSADSALPGRALAGAGLGVAASVVAAREKRRAARRRCGQNIVVARAESATVVVNGEKRPGFALNIKGLPRSPLVLDAETEDSLTEAAKAFSWLNVGPPESSACYKALFKHFPGAMPSSAIHARSRSMLEQYGFTPENTIFGTSICPDEINNEKGDLVDLMKTHWGELFPLGGIGGAPFVGKTGFGAFSAHVPEGGNIFMAFGPHVAVSETGEVGKYMRQGQSSASAACGACIGAYNACCEGAADVNDKANFDDCDMQMAWIKRQVQQHVADIRKQDNPMAALAYRSHESVKELLFDVVNTNFGEGYLALIGGILVNMPLPYEDHFVPLTFEVRRHGKPTIDLLAEWYRRIPFHTGDLVTSEAKATRMQHMVHSWLRWAPKLDEPAYTTLHTHFPGALPGIALHARLRVTLEAEPFGLTPENTLVGTSVCPDEINNETGDLTDLLREYWGACFPLGGISGSPFVGETGFGAFSAHVPDNGNIIVFFGPHVAISESGEIGKYLREGQSHESTACGAVIGAYCACREGNSSNRSHGWGLLRWLRGRRQQEDSGAFDMQMSWIKEQLAPHVSRISKETDPMAALSHQSYEMVKGAVEQIVNTNFGSGHLILVGGLQINMQPPYNDHFLPRMFEVRQKGEAPKDLLHSLKASKAERQAA